MKLVKDIEKDASKSLKVSDKEAEEAFKTILTWIGENPKREGLIETPRRVVKAFKEYFKGYHQNAEADLSKTFGDVEGYDDMVVEKNITMESHCEHHMAPIIGVAHVAYIPNKKVVGLSKLNRIVEHFGRRGAIQEQLTSAIHNAVNKICEDNLGVIITIVATHNCVSCRGVKHRGAAMVTTKASGVFRHNGNDARQEFFNSLKINNGGHQI